MIFVDANSLSHQQIVVVLFGLKAITLSIG